MQGRNYVKKGCYLSTEEARQVVAMLYSVWNKDRARIGNTKIIAKALKVSPATVRDYLRHVFSPSPAVARRIRDLHERL